MAPIKVDVEPEEVGFDGARLARIDRHYRRYVDDGRLPGWTVVVTRHGRVVAVLVSPDVLRARRASGVWNEADRIDELLQTARSEPLRTAALGPDRADELVKEVRRGRSGR